jgi:hypothetical protein
MRVPVAAGVAALGLALQACAAGPQLSPSDHRAAIRQMVSDTLTQLYQSYPDTQSRIRTAAGSDPERLNQPWSHRDTRR